MKTEIIQHEILLLMSSGFCKRQFCSKNENDQGRKLSPGEELEKACWDGMLYEMFPEIMESFSARCERFIWNIMSGKHYLRICLGPAPATLKSETTIDPYYYVLSYSEN